MSRQRRINAYAGKNGDVPGSSEYSRRQAFAKDLEGAIEPNLQRLDTDGSRRPLVGKARDSLEAWYRAIGCRVEQQ